MSDPARCYECGWRGDWEQVEGGEPTADTGDYDDPRCPCCGGTDVNEPGWTHYRWPLMTWRRLTLWGPRRKLDRDVCDLGYCLHHGYEPPPPETWRERLELWLAKRLVRSVQRKEAKNVWPARVQKRCIPRGSIQRRRCA